MNFVPSKISKYIIVGYLEFATRIESIDIQYGFCTLEDHQVLYLPIIYIYLNGSVFEFHIHGCVFEFHI